MAVLRPHLALTVSDVERSTEFYRALFGVEPTKERPGYAKFEVAEPALNFTLNEGERGDGLGAFNHAGIQVASTGTPVRFASSALSCSTRMFAMTPRFCAVIAASLASPTRSAASWVRRRMSRRSRPSRRRR